MAISKANANYYERRNQKLYRQAKAPINAKGSSLDKKHRKGV